jgi:hypothetical protein
MSDTFVAFFAGILILATIYVLVRPGSTGPVIVNSVLSTLTDLVRGSIGYTFDSQSGKWTPP